MRCFSVGIMNINDAFDVLTTDELACITGGAGAAPAVPAKSPFIPKIEDGRKVWVISRKDLLKENAGFPLDPRW